jgi:putative membrane protein
MRYVYWALIALVAVVCATFAVSNRDLVELTFWPLPVAYELPLYLVVLVTLVLGFVIGRLTAWLGHLGTKRDRRRLAKHAQRLEAELGRVQGEAANTDPGRSLVA